MKDNYRILTSLYADIAKKDIRNFDEINSNTTFLNSFNRDDFYNNLYVEVSVEKILLNRLQTNEINGKLFALCGPQGSGKSTISYKVISELSKNKEDKIIFVDARPEKASKEFDDNHDNISEDYIRSLILDAFRSEFPLYDENSEDRINKEYIDLFYFLLSPESEIKKKKSNMYHMYSKLVNEVSELFIYQNAENLNFREWFSFMYKNNLLELKDITRKATDFLDVAHYVEYTINYLRKYKRIIIWIDNIDAFSNIQQQQFVGILQNIQRNILSYSIIIVAVREENIYRVGNTADCFNPPYISTITFTDNGNSNSNGTGALNVPVMNNENLQKIIEKKLKFTYAKYNENADLVKKGNIENIDIFSKESIEKIIKEKANFFELQNQNKENEKKRNYYDYYCLSNVQFQSLNKLSTKINECFFKEKVIYLANNSLKHYQQIHSSFLLFVLNNIQISNLGVIDVDEYKETNIITDFLSWIHTVSEPFNVNTFNIIDELVESNITQDNSIGCFLPYIILTRIWNENVHLYNHPAPDNNPFIYKIVNDIREDFGFTQDKILEIIFKLYKYQWEQGKGNFITFRTKKKLETPMDIDLNSTVRITYRGKVTIGHIINSYGYFKDCVDSLKNIEDDDIEINDLVTKNISLICKFHLTALISIKNKMKNKNKKNWFDYYLSRYGIPLDPEYVRNPHLGRRGSKFKSCIYLTALFDSLSSYFHLPTKYKKEVERMSNSFNTILDEIMDSNTITLEKINAAFSYE